MGRVALLALIGLLVACRRDMHDQPKYKALRSSPFFADGRASRPVVDGTVARGHLELDGARTTGKVGATYAPNPLPRTAATFARGHERYDIYCAPCHDRVGTGNGMIVERGFKQAPSFHQDRLRAVADGYLFETMTEGFGVMPSYAAQIPTDDRWAIAAWVRVLQRSQYATVADVPENDRSKLDASLPKAEP